MGNLGNLLAYWAALQEREYKLFISHAWDYSDDYDGVVRLLNGEYGFKWTDLSVPKEYPLATRPVLSQSYRYLIRQLDERIRQVDCLLVIAGMYVKNRGWIQAEIDAALEFKTPIIAVYPFGCERVPSELSKTPVAEWVGWRGSSVTSAIRKHAPTPSSIPPPSSDYFGALTALMPSSKGGAVPFLGSPTSYEPYPSLNVLGGLDPVKEPETPALSNLIYLLNLPKK